MAKKAKKQELRQDNKVKSTDEKLGYNFWVFGLIGIFVAFLAVFCIYNYYSSNFNYIGLNFQKIKIGNLTFFYSKLPLANSEGEIVNYFNLYLRNDPRNLGDVKITGLLRLKNKLVMASDYLKCEDNGIAGGELGNAIAPWGIQVIPASVNKTFAEEKNLQHATCDQSSGFYIDSSVLIFKPSNVTEIAQKAQNCYEVSVKDCEVLKAVEKLILGLYAHAKGLEI